jgi:hypothetical protein
MSDAAARPGDSPWSLVSEWAPTLPPAALLAAWGTASLTGGASADQARDAIEGDNEPHTVTGASGDGKLADLLSQLRANGTTGLRLILPQPGRMLGLPGPAAVNAAALAVGQCAATVNGVPLLVYPQLTPFGSPHEPGLEVSWQVRASAGPAIADFVDVRQADRQLREGLLAGIEQLEELDVASWHPAAQPLVVGRAAATPATQLPPSATSEAGQLLDLAWRVADIIRAATVDAGHTGAAISTWEVSQRTQALSRLAGLAHEAIAAAINDPLKFQL